MTRLDSRVPPPSGRIVELDGLRGIAILLIIVVHYVKGWAHPAKGTALGYLQSSISLTWSGVDLFFVLSGFLIAGILLEQKETANYFSVFYLRRIHRIFPLYFLLLGLYVAARALIGHQTHLEWVFGNPMPIWRYVTFTQNIPLSPPAFAGAWLAVTWSLAVEEQFYLVLPLMIRFLPLRVLPPLLLMLAGMAVGLRALGPHFISYMGMPWRADSLLMGALLAYGVRRGDFMGFLVAKKRILWALFAAMLLGTGALSSSALLNWAQQGGVFIHFWFALFFTALLALALVERGGWLGTVLRGRVLVWFGAVSYGIYMIHEIVLGMLHALAGNAEPVLRNPRDFAITAAAFVLTLLVAALSFYGMERPILRRGHRIRYQPRAAASDISDALPATAESLS